MKRLTITFLILSLFLISCSASGMPEARFQQTKVQATSNPISNKDNNINFDSPGKSGIVKVLPWSQDAEFLKAQNSLGTRITLGAYCTVLKDPLPGEEENVHLAARKIAGTIVKPGEVFSQNRKAGPYTLDRGYQKGPTYIGSKLSTTIGGGVCKIASTLYNVTVLSNLQVIERHAHGMPVPYVPYGQDATVSYGAKDFKFKNNTGSPVLVWAKGIDNKLYMAFYGMEDPPKVEWGHETISTQKAGKIYKKNTSLAPGTEKVIVEGMDGAIIKSWVTIWDINGSSKTKALGTSRYRPMNYIIERN